MSPVVVSIPAAFGRDNWSGDAGDYAICARGCRHGGWEQQAKKDTAVGECWPGILRRMSEKIIALLVWLIGSGVRGYASVVLMAGQSACIPIPSEVILPLAGVALVHTLGRRDEVQMQLVLLATVASWRRTWVDTGVLGGGAGRAADGGTLRQWLLLSRATWTG